MQGQRQYIDTPHNAPCFVERSKGVVCRRRPAARWTHLVENRSNALPTTRTGFRAKRPTDFARFPGSGLSQPD
jgi:hypothetical protein